MLIIDPILRILIEILSLYIWVVIIMAVLSWLVAFNVINTRNRFVYSVLDILSRVTEPALKPIRRVLPYLGGVDISPIILFFIIRLVQYILENVRVALLTGNGF